MICGNFCEVRGPNNIIIGIEARVTHNSISHPPDRNKCGDKAFDELANQLVQLNKPARDAIQSNKSNGLNKNVRVLWALVFTLSYVMQ